MLNPPVKPGFCFRALTADGQKNVAVNVCGHNSIGVALTKSMDPAPECYLDEYGLDNLIVPISVDAPLQCDGKEYSYITNVVVHNSLIERCLKGHRLSDHYITRLTSLAIDWILQEYGLKLDTRSCRLIHGKTYVDYAGKNAEQIFSEAAKALERGIKRGENSSDSDVVDPLVSKFNMENKCSSAESKHAPLITEMPTGSGIRKGFLCNARLYGCEGSGECNQPPHDPLLHIPKNIRKRCQVIDTRQSGHVLSTVAPPRATPEKDGKPPITQCPPLAEPDEWKVESLEYGEKSVIIRLLPPPNVTSMEGINLEATPNSIEIDGTKVRLSRTVAVDNISAKFLKLSNKLLLTCPFV
ncbi:unnamed protein product [Trypanosoma congolense IL3000]|uniref:WGS project CAEQ00000000 data, annotated contig 153 n=1 Tax=Trypanosoma congolense (strain IL3000) TaxID=1068625 RepID=F9W6W0_TRYCI|nr:unnamed protein product [Trypanosoma congolense IL3000]